jgi:dTDP-glucose 4,6-dehydratase
MKILCSGNLGFIFSNVTEYFLDNGHTVVGIDAEYDGSHPELVKQWKQRYGDRYIHYKMDINMINQFVEEPQTDMNLRQCFDVIINAAAESNVDKSITDQIPFIQSNIFGTYQMLQYAHHYPPKLFLHVSTDEVYGDNQNPGDIDRVLQPGNPYSASKASQEMFVQAYGKTYGLNYKIIRMCNIIGQRQATTKLIPRVIDAIQNDKEIPVYDGGIATREYMDVRDVPPLIELVLNSKDIIHNLTWNQELNTNEVIDRISKIMKKSPTIISSSRKGHDMSYKMIPSIICSEFKNFHNFEETIRWMLHILNQCSYCEKQIENYIERDIMVNRNKILKKFCSEECAFYAQCSAD